MVKDDKPPSEHHDGMQDHPVMGLTLAQGRERRRSQVGEPLEPLTDELLKQRSLELSPTNYLTIVSIVQGVALALLIQQTFDRLQKDRLAVAPVLLQAFAVLLILAFVFHFYSATSILSRWLPSFMDAVVPFVIGSCEIVPAFYVGRGFSWSVAVSTFWAVALCGLIVTAIYTPKGHFGDCSNSEYEIKAEHAKKRYDQLLLLCGLIASATAAVVLFFGSLAQSYPEDLNKWSAWAGGAAIVGLLAMVTVMEKKLVQIYGVYGIERSMFG